MKSIVRWGAVLSLVGSVLLGPSLTANSSRALALPPEQIMQKLRAVPVFTITDENGSPLVASTSEGGQGSSVTGVFISRQDALAFVDRLTTQNPELANNVQVVPVSLAEVYQLAQQMQNNPEQLGFDFVPVDRQVNLALEVLREDGKEVEQFNGVPLFLATGGPDNGYLTVQNGNQQVIPLFFNKEELDRVLDQFRTQNPDLAGTVDVQVVNLQGVIQLLQESNDSELNKIMLIPPRESIDYVRSLQPQSGGQQ